MEGPVSAPLQGPLSLLDRSNHEALSQPELLGRTERPLLFRRASQKEFDAASVWQLFAVTLAALATAYLLLLCLQDIRVDLGGSGAGRALADGGGGTDGTCRWSFRKAEWHEEETSQDEAPPMGAPEATLPQVQHSSGGGAPPFVFGGPEGPPLRATGYLQGRPGGVPQTQPSHEAEGGAAAAAVWAPEWVGPALAPSLYGTGEPVPQVHAQMPYAPSQPDVAAWLVEGHRTASVDERHVEADVDRALERRTIGTPAEWEDRQIPDEVRAQVKSMLLRIVHNADICKALLPALSSQHCIELTIQVIKISSTLLGAVSFVPSDMEPFRQQAGLALTELARLAIEACRPHPPLAPLVSVLNKLSDFAHGVSLQRPHREHLGPQQYMKKMMALLGHVPTVQKHLTAILAGLARYMRGSFRGPPGFLVQQQLRVLQALHTTYIEQFLRESAIRAFVLNCQRLYAPWTLYTREQLNEAKKGRLAPLKELVAQLDNAVSAAGGPPPRPSELEYAAAMGQGMLQEHEQMPDVLQGAWAVQPAQHVADPGPQSGLVGSAAVGPGMLQGTGQGPQVLRGAWKSPPVQHAAGPVSQPGYGDSHGRGSGTVQRAAERSHMLQGAWRDPGVDQAVLQANAVTQQPHAGGPLSEALQHLRHTRGAGIQPTHGLPQPYTLSYQRTTAPASKQPMQQPSAMQYTPAASPRAQSAGVPRMHLSPDDASRYPSSALFPGTAPLLPRTPAPHPRLWLPHVHLAHPNTTEATITTGGGMVSRSSGQAFRAPPGLRQQSILHSGHEPGVHPRPPSPDADDEVLARLFRTGLKWEEVFPDDDGDAPGH